MASSLCIPQRRLARILVTVASVGAAALVPIATAQLVLESIDTVRQGEAADLRGAAVNGIPYSPELDLLLLCIGGGSGGDYGYVDTNRDGMVDTLRQYGAAMVSADQWRTAGSRLLSPLRNQAILRAQSAIAQAIAIVTLVDNGLVDSFSASLDAMSLLSQSDERTRTQANEIIRGAAVTGMRIVSLPASDDPHSSNGVCVIVRYDAPISLNNLRPLPPPGSTGRVSPGGAVPPGNNPPPRPGSAGDFGP